MNTNLIEVLDKAVTLYNKSASEENQLDLYDIFDEIDKNDDYALMIAISDILANIQ